MLFHDVGKVPSLAAREGKCAVAWSGTWQANSNCIILHGKKLCQSTPWKQFGGGCGGRGI